MGDGSVLTYIDIQNIWLLSQVYSKLGVINSLETTSEKLQFKTGERHRHWSRAPSEDIVYSLGFFRGLFQISEVLN